MAKAQIIYLQQKMDKDLFGFKTQGKLYDAYRPQYPKEQLQATLKRVSRKHKYLDIATGTGQILFELAKQFGQVRAIDISPKMIGVCHEKEKSYEHPSIKVELMDVMSLQDNEKYDLITIGQALHWFPIKESLTKIYGILEKNGMLAVYGYVAKTLANAEGQRTNHHDTLFYNFYDKKVKQYFDFNRDELHNYYSDKQRYPFEEFFHVEKEVVEVTSKMSKQALIGYLRTFSGYNTYLEKNLDDPLKQIEQGLDGNASCIFDFFVLWCQRKCDI